MYRAIVGPQEDLFVAVRASRQEAMQLPSATMCKVGRDHPINIVAEGPLGLLRLPATCRVCRPMARVYQEAKAPLSHHCQHGMERP